MANSGGSEPIDTANDSLALALGKGLIICQVFENSLLMLLSLISEHKLPSDGAEFKQTWDFASKKTLGQLFHHLKKELDIPVDAEAYLQAGVDLRNELVHRFLHENIRLLSNNHGKNEAANKVRAITQEIRKRDKVVGKLIDALLNKYGLSQVALKDLAGVFWN